MSYGISTSFPVLSRLERQVAHALLTRPPLRYFKQALRISVRLECVMHAASVHPEPGSNSRLKKFILAIFSLLFSFRNCRDLVVKYLYLTSFCTFSYFRTLYSLFVVQFSRIISAPFRFPLFGRSIIISLIPPFVNTLFSLTFTFVGLHNFYLYKR